MAWSIPPWSRNITQPKLNSNPNPIPSPYPYPNPNPSPNPSPNASPNPNPNPSPYPNSISLLHGGIASPLQQSSMTIEYKDHHAAL